MLETLTSNFLRISKIPRESGHEEKIADFFISVARKNHLYYFKDENNNVLIKKNGNIIAKPIALQAHLDMVCTKTEDSKHDFNSDGIEVIINGNTVTAKDTSLGADQGVGLAMMLTILEDDNLKHPDLEFIFTVEEETTFKGAVTFPYHLVESKRLINLDNDKDNTVLVGADGDICNVYSFKSEFIANNLPSYKVLIQGYPSGNSGANIALSKTNAIVTMANILKNKNVFLKSIKGGTSENDLAAFCEVIINTELNVRELFKGLNVQITNFDNKVSFSKQDTERIINQVLELKSGYISNHLSSANLGLINTIDNEVKIYYIFRSMSDRELENININSQSLNNNFKTIEMYRDSIWEINNKSQILKKYKQVYFDEYSEDIREEIGHGGIECSAIKKRINGVDLISIGANIENMHTVDEITYINSWLKTYNLLIKFLESLD
ncbi:MAG: aminoacyl-histidine dipeptidase [Bacilli bacterium]|nr:aminoacyl-histidine dipeptidase [Bacilli bacterium]